MTMIISSRSAGTLVDSKQSLLERYNSISRLYEATHVSGKQLVLTHFTLLSI